MTKEFIKQLMAILNGDGEQYTAYYQKAPKSAKYPYVVVPKISFSPIDSNYFTIFDIEVFASNDLLIEDITDLLIRELSDKHFCNEKIGFHLGFENNHLQQSKEIDLDIRRISFSAKIFYIGGN